MSADKPGGDGHAHSTALHLPHGSWWPFWLANAIAFLLLGLIMLGRAMNLNGGDASSIPVPVALGVVGFAVLLLVATLIGWFLQDFKWWNEKLGTGEHVPKAGILLFIGSEVFLFGALFTVYFSFKGLSLGHWPDSHVELPLLKTAVFSLFLFSSSWTIHKAEGHIKRGEHKEFRNWWLATIVLGAIFLGGQVWEYTNLIREGATLGSGQFMSAFYLLTGTHGLHVFGGLCALAVVYLRAAKGQFSAERHAFPQAASMYWHFVDLVWVLVYSVLYIANFWHQIPGLGDA
ncbi:MAG: cytochrome c oxidase subunit 3 [Candidatus Thermoplasmatota archaeon]|jgi:cytochrome c oxidase subunit 3